MANLRFTDKNELVGLPGDNYIMPIETDDPTPLSLKIKWANVKSAIQAAVGSGAILTGNLVWVDKVTGNNATGLRGRLDKPFLTITAAQAAATAFDTVVVLPGNYTGEAGSWTKSDISYYFYPGARVTGTGPTLFTVATNVLGYGIFTNNGSIAIMEGAQGTFEALAVYCTNTTSMVIAITNNDGIFNVKIGHLEGGKQALSVIDASGSSYCVTQVEIGRLMNVEDINRFANPALDAVVYWAGDKRSLLTIRAYQVDYFGSIYLVAGTVSVIFGQVGQGPVIQANTETRRCVIKDSVLRTNLEESPVVGAFNEGASPVGSLIFRGSNHLYHADGYAPLGVYGPTVPPVIKVHGKLLMNVESGGFVFSTGAADVEIDTAAP